MFPINGQWRALFGDTECQILRHLEVRCPHGHFQRWSRHRGRVGGVPQLRAEGNSVGVELSHCQAVSFSRICCSISSAWTRASAQAFSDLSAGKSDSCGVRRLHLRQDDVLVQAPTPGCVSAQCELHRQVRWECYQSQETHLPDREQSTGGLELFQRVRGATEFAQRREAHSSAYSLPCNLGYA